MLSVYIGATAVIGYNVYQFVFVSDLLAYIPGKTSLYWSTRLKQSVTVAAIASAALPFCFIASTSMAFELYHEANRIHTGPMDNTFDDFDIVPSKPPMASFSRI